MTRSMGTLRRRCAPALMIALASVVTACGLSNDQAREAERIALGDERLADFLADSPHAVVEVRRPRYASETDVVVEIGFDDPVPREEYPLDMCDSGGPEITGVRWLVDTEKDSVRAVTPVWYSLSCFPSSI